MRTVALTHFFTYWIIAQKENNVKNDSDEKCENTKLSKIEHDNKAFFGCNFCPIQ